MSKNSKGKQHDASSRQPENNVRSLFLTLTALVAALTPLGSAMALELDGIFKRADFEKAFHDWITSLVKRFPIDWKFTPHDRDVLINTIYDYIQTRPSISYISRQECEEVIDIALKAKNPRGVIYIISLVVADQPSILGEAIEIATVPPNALKAKFKDLPDAFMQRGTLQVKGLTMPDMDPETELWFQPVGDAHASHFVNEFAKFRQQILNGGSAVRTFASTSRKIAPTVNLGDTSSNS
jgi:hypothetical protein